MNAKFPEPVSSNLYDCFRDHKYKYPGKMMSLWTKLLSILYFQYFYLFLHPPTVSWASRIPCRSYLSHSVRPMSTFLFFFFYCSAKWNFLPFLKEPVNGWDIYIYVAKRPNLLPAPFPLFILLLTCMILLHFMPQK